MKQIMIFGFFALLFLSACVQTTQEPLKLGVIAPMTGPNGWIGEEDVPAAELAVKQINEQGGINGRELKIILEDATTSQQASTATSKLINVDNVDAIYAITTPVVASASAIAEQSKKVLFGFTSVNTFAKKNTYVFSDLRDIENECRQIAESALKQGDLKLGFLGNDADLSTECISSLKKNFEPKGGSIVANEMKVSNDPDARTMLTKIKQAQPDGVVLVCWPPDCNVIYKQMMELEVHPRLYIPVLMSFGANKISTEGVDTSVIFKDAIGIEQGLDVDKPTPGFAQYIKDYESYAGKKPKIPADSVVVADNIHMLAIAMRKCPDLNSDCIRNRMTETDYEGYAGRIVYGGKNIATRPIRAIMFKDGKWANLEA